MINTYKSNQNAPTPQIAGLFPSDESIEFAGIRDTKKVLWLQNGNTHYFKDLPFKYFNLLKEAYLQDDKAIAFISKIHKHVTDQVELYTYYMYGDLDSTPDIENGKLSESENFRDKRNCPSLLWNKKQMTIDNYILTPRDLVMIDLMADDYKDAVIAESIGVSHSYYDQLKRNLFTYTKTETKTALVLKAKDQKVI
jgi:DNA-binding CsgD family transcriptional regulator